MVTNLCYGYARHDSIFLFFVLRPNLYDPLHIFYLMIENKLFSSKVQLDVIMPHSLSLSPQREKGEEREGERDEIIDG